MCLHYNGMAAEVRDLLESGLTNFPGSVDKLRNPLLFVRLEHISVIDNSSVSEIKKYLSYLVSISRKEVQENGFAFCIDCTKAPTSAVPDILDIIHDYFPGTVNRIYIIQSGSEEGVFGKAFVRFKTFVSSIQGTDNLQTQTINGYDDINRFVDPHQIPSFLQGHLSFDQKLWVETRIELETFIKDSYASLDNIDHHQDTLISTIPRSLKEILSFEQKITDLREKVYVPARNVIHKGEVLLQEITVAKTGGTGPSRFRQCPLSIVHIIGSKQIKGIFDKLVERADNFNNLWGLQMQKMYLEKFIYTSTVITTKLTELEETMSEPLLLTLDNTEYQFFFYSSIQTSITGDDKALYEHCISSYTSLRDWNYTESFPIEDVENKVPELSRLWALCTPLICERFKTLRYYNSLRQILTLLDKECESVQGLLESYKISADNKDNKLALHHHQNISNSVKLLVEKIGSNLEGYSDSKPVKCNINVQVYNNLAQSLRDRSTFIISTEQLSANVKEIVVKFFNNVSTITNWIQDTGRPFLKKQTLGRNLEESKECKTKFIKFLATSGLDKTKYTVSDCSKCSAVIVNSHCSDEVGTTLVRDIYNKTEQAWKAFGLEVQEHSRDIELSIEFFEAVEGLNNWLFNANGGEVGVLLVEECETTVDAEDTLAKVDSFKDSMKLKSDLMDLCHSKYIALSASNNTSLQHITTTKSGIDKKWNTLSESVRLAEKKLEKKVKEKGSDSETLETSSIGSVDSEEDYALSRNTKMLISELLNTERAYVEDLRDVVVGYKQRMEKDAQCPEQMRDNADVIFGNIEDIYVFHSKFFLSDLEKALDDKNVIGGLFCNNRARFEIYATYCKNKPHSENYLSTVDRAYLKLCQEKLQHKLDLSSYLLKPVQRIMKYHLILEKLLKYAPKRNEKNIKELTEALEIMERVPRYANDMIHLMGLEGYEGDIQCNGQLLLQDSFQVYLRGQRKPTTRQIFIFERAVLFSKPIPGTHKSNTPKYQFKNELKIDEIGITCDVSADVTKCQFQLDVFKKKGSRGESYIIHAKSLEIKKMWTDKIQALLLVQFMSMKSRAASMIL